MNLMGIGTDLVDCRRIDKLMTKYGMRFVQRILTKEEIKNFQNSTNPCAYLAKRFAAKEAVAKALGTGIGAKLAFNEIGILNLPSGKPTVQFIGNSKQYVQTQYIKEVFVSLSDEKNMAMAFVVVTR
ncbi:MAG: holo-ACP synthase [Proteobacteria bacterium]|nr:holo-ACP synthase [Pseudomonadota bacterium]